MGSYKNPTGSDIVILHPADPTNEPPAPLAGGSIGKLIEFPANSTFEATDPAVIPFFSGTFVATNPTMLLDTDIFARSIGFGTASLWLAVCDQTLGRSPYPKTQAEFLAAPAGISYYALGSVAPSMEKLDLTAVPNSLSMASRAGRKIRMTGLTVGHTYNFDLCFSVQGNGSQSFTTALNLFRCTVAATKTGKLKLYLGRFTPTGSGVTVVQFDGLRPIGDPVQGATIAASAGEHIQAISTSRDQTRVLAGGYSTAALGSLYVIDTSTDTLAYAAVPLADVPMGFAHSLDGTKAWIALLSGNIRQVTIATGALGAPIATGGQPNDIAITPDGTKVLTVCKTTKEVKFHDGTTGALTGAAVPIPDVSGVTASPNTICVNNEGTMAYVVDSGTGYLYEINIATRAITRTMNVGVKTWNRVLCYPGTQTKTVQLFGQLGTGQYGIRQINVPDWVSYVDWTTDGMVDGWIGPRGEIFGLDTTAGKIQYWMGCRFAIKNVFPGAGPDFVWGEHAQILVSPSQ